MYTLPVETIDGIVNETIFEIKELSYLGKLLECKESKKRGISYLEIPCAFDIETTNIYQRDISGHICKEPRPFAFMYHWQFCLDDQVCFGRTWEEFQLLIETLQKRMNLDEKHRLVIFVHNLPFETQFMHRFINITDGFFRAERKPLKLVVDNCIEFRCSYALSNMTLQKFCENERDVKHYKLSGDAYDYNKIRTSIDELSDYEKAYCYNDVRGLCECIKSRMQEDTLASMPMTSTGYVRRECRIEVKKNKKNRRNLIDSRLNEEEYTMLRKGCFRGGNTHANANYVNQVIKNPEGDDIKSSYPWNMLNIFNDYPVGKWFDITTRSFYNRDLTGYVYMITIRVKNLHYIGNTGIPYIAASKTKYIHDTNTVLDNGRIRFCSLAEMTLTNIDFEIMNAEYRYDDLWIGKIKCCKAGNINKELRSCILKYFHAKCELDGVEDKAYEYMKSKNRLNGIYGMSVMAIDQDLYKYVDGQYEKKEQTLYESLEQFYKSRNSFLRYDQGVFVTANARKQLQEMLWTVGEDVIYCDTDSIKFIGDHQWQFDKKNEEIRAQADASGAYCDISDRRIYLGVWEHEGKQFPTYEEFKTLGAKKYVVKENEIYKSTIAGVNKKAGAAFFNEHGIDSFKIGTKIENSGHLVAYYNDDEIHKIVVNHVEMTSASNVALVDDTYTIGVTEDYIDLLESLIDKEEKMIYI